MNLREMTPQEREVTMAEWREKDSLKQEAEMAGRHKIKEFANLCGYSDVEPYEVVETRTPNKVMIRFMDSEMLTPAKCVAIGGFVGHFDNYTQTWENSSNEEYPLVAIRWSKAKGYWFDKYGRRFSMSDKAVKFYDNNF